REHLADVPNGAERVKAGLDVLYAQYSGRLFAAVVELALASRADTELREVIQAEEHNIAETMRTTAAVIFGDGFPATRDEAARWATLLSAIRGIALLNLLGHSQGGVDRQWEASRAHLVA